MSGTVHLTMTPLQQANDSVEFLQSERWGL